MKKFIFIVSVLIIVSVLLGGCNVLSGNGQNHKYLIASMGFDSHGSNIKVTVEAVAVNSEDAAGKKRILLSGNGKTPQQAMEEAEKKATQPFDLGHCGVIVLGLGLSKDDFAEICKYCYDTDEITFSVYMLTADNSRKLLEADPISSVAAGYDIMSIMDKESKRWSDELHNSLYEVTAQNERKASVRLPYFTLLDDCRVMEKVAVYKDNEFEKLEKI